MQIISASYVKSSPDNIQCPAPDRPEYAFIGRSNVGKSSLINMLTGKSGLAKTSAAPGKTQLINHFDIQSYLIHASGKKAMGWYLVDLPGYGYAKVSQKQRSTWQQMIAGYIRKRENLGNLFVLIDSRHEPQAIDLEFIRQLGDWGVPFSVVFTKADKNKPLVTERNTTLFMDRLREDWEPLPEHFITAATTAAGRDKLLDYISELNAGYMRIKKD
ncbi:ribosome biogenesis GTP-binding protein YihA/YsxC [Niabella terrae]